jgi:hypothetical protein
MPMELNNELCRQKNDVEGIKRKQKVVGGFVVSNAVVSFLYLLIFYKI